MVLQILLVPATAVCTGRPGVWCLTESPQNKRVCIAVQPGNKIGSVSSETITVNVLYAPIDVRVTAPAVAVVGEHITLRCGARGNPVVNRYRWRQLCASQSTHLGAGGAEYTLNATVELSTCDYFCSASNSLGQTESPAQRINVQYAPINVSVVLEAAEVEEGKELTLQCQNTANPPSHRYHWWKDCSGILQDLEGNDSKLVTSFDIADQTCHYYCSATNKIGIQESGAKTVRVLCGVMGHDDCSGCFRMGTGTMVGIVVGALAITRSNCSGNVLPH
ncbi:B-cell receptor CD22-like [Rhinoraja longicauda]